MKSVYRTVVIVKPRQPFVEWINTSPELEMGDHPTSVEELQQDCNAYLVPETIALEEALEQLEPLKPRLFEMELEGWLLNQRGWPKERTAEVFDQWFALEAHSAVWDLADEPFYYDEALEDEGEEIKQELAITPDQVLDDADPLKQFLRQLSHSQIYQIWVQGQAGGRLEGEAAGLYKVMRQHPEHRRLWERLDQASGAELLQGGMDPVLHIMLHQVVENQIAQHDPAEVVETVKRLMRKNYTRHQAIHAVAGVLIEEMYDMLREGRPFNEEEYVRELKELGKRGREY